ncbi:MAG: hypothetical protein IKL14_01425 [Alphaproteobacteria bacterium]|nr:hypothetical protein [Alphaproteobacteria bacterium]
MQKYIAQVKEFFSLVKEQMAKSAVNPRISAESLANLRVAQHAVAEMESEIIANPYGIIWIDLTINFDCAKNCTMTSRENLINLFMWANKKSPVAHARDVQTVDIMLRMGAACMFGTQVDPNTMNTIEPVKVYADTLTVIMEQKKVNFVHKK